MHPSSVIFPFLKVLYLAEHAIDHSVSRHFLTDGGNRVARRRF